MSGVQSSAKAPKGKVQQNVVLSPDVSGGDVVSLKESKTQLLRYLNNEVERTAKGLKEEVEAREKIERWIKESYRPTLAKIREQLVDEMAEVREREGERGREGWGERERRREERREKRERERREREEKFSLSHTLHTQLQRFVNPSNPSNSLRKDSRSGSKRISAPSASASRR
jgi:hypothetical protein